MVPLVRSSIDLFLSPFTLFERLNRLWYNFPRHLTITSQCVGKVVCPCCPSLGSGDTSKLLSSLFDYLSSLSFYPTRFVGSVLMWWHIMVQVILLFLLLYPFSKTNIFVHKSLFYYCGFYYFHDDDADVCCVVVMTQIYSTIIIKEMISAHSSGGIHDDGPSIRLRWWGMIMSHWRYILVFCLSCHPPTSFYLVLLSCF